MIEELLKGTINIICKKKNGVSIFYTTSLVSAGIREGFENH